MRDARPITPELLAIDHVALTASDLEVTCAFYDALFGARVLDDHKRGTATIVRVLIVGSGVRLSIHQAGNGVELVARHPLPGSADLCFRWGGSIADAVAHLTQRMIPIIEGPSPRRTAQGQPAQSVYFNDPDGNLIELMAADGSWSQQ